MRRDVLQSCSLTAFSDHVPDDILGDPGAPDFSASGHGAKNLSGPDSRGRNPLVERLLRPLRNRNRANMATFTDEIDDGPVPLPGLNVINL